MVSIAIFITCLISAAFFAATEVAFFSLTPLTVARGNRDRLERLLIKKNDIIAMLLTGNNLAIVGGTLALDALIPQDRDIWYKFGAFFSELVLFFLLAEALPKAVGRRKNILLLEKSYSLIWLFYYLLLPMSYVFLRISRLMAQAGASRPDDARLEVFRFISAHTSDSKLPLAESLATYSSTTIREIMTPMSELFSLGAASRLRECAETIERSSYSRYPVYDTIPAEIVGYLDMRDLLDKPGSTRVRQVMRPAHFFPASLTVDQLHAEMRRLAVPMVFVVNEYGLILGMVTEENLAEELVGDIFSHDQKLETQYLVEKENGWFEIDCVMDIDDFSKVFGGQIRKEHFETVAGYLLSQCGRIPALGEEFDLPPGKFVVTEANERAVRRVKFKPRRLSGATSNP
jgi:CBS domain containing-hemolysin-like protein